MSKNNDSLEKALAEISSQGIRADRKHLLEDIGAQFSDKREWIREYVVNAADAGASWCRIWGSEQGGEITIFIQDNGRGMDRQRVVDFMTLFRSVKDGDPRKAVGRFGVGKASILALSGLTGLTMETSTGKEGWKMENCSLLDSNPVRIKKVEPPAEAGTTFGITFRADVPLAAELEKLGNILFRYVRFLPMTITIQNLETPLKGSAGFRYINDQWSAYSEYCGHKYIFTLESCSFEAIMSLGSGSHEIYQNRVLVTDRYNLLFYDLADTISLPRLSIRVDSPDFELPFGRHGLRNEEVLPPLSRYLRDVILPQYFDELVEVSRQSTGEVVEVRVEDVEDIAAALLWFDCGRKRTWSRIPLFYLWGGRRISFVELQKVVDEKGRLYVEDQRSPGADYALFDAPVLLSIQPEGGLKFLQKFFGKRLLNLSDKDMVLEQSVTGNRKLSDEELAFEATLGFHPAVVSAYKEGRSGFGEKSEEDDASELIDLSSLVEDLAGMHNMGREAVGARSELEDIAWRVNYLVERDGVTPCTRQKFLFRENRVVLNLHHPEVVRLLRLSRKMPTLAGHWALAMCLYGEGKILPHLTPEAREDLIRLDAMVRSQAQGMPPRKKTGKDVDSDSFSEAFFRDHLQMLARQFGISRNLS